MNVGWIQDGDWMSYSNINLTGMKSVKARISSEVSGGTIEVRTGSITGTLIATIPVSNTGGFQTWQTDSVNLASVSSTYDVFLIFIGGTGYLYNINWLGFSEESIIITDLPHSSQLTPSVYPNPTTGIVHLSENTNYKVLNSVGQEILNGKATKIDLSNEPNGIYILKTSGSIKKLVKE